MRRSARALSIGWAALGLAISLGASRDSKAQGAGPEGRLPPGHPAVPNADDTDEPDDDSSEETLPPGHPAIGQPSGTPAASATALPPGHPGAGTHGAPTRAATPGQVPEDQSEIDPSLPSGAIEIEVRDLNETPVGGAVVNLGIVVQSVAKGESHRQKTGQTDETGHLHFGGLESGAGFAYRVTVPWTRDKNGLDSSATATYAAPPFQLDLSRGERAVVHVYPVTTHLEEALIGSRGILYVQLKDDVIQIEQLYRIFNFGPVTWVPHDVTVDLPRGWKALNVQKQMSDVGLEPVEGKGGRLLGTFPPGQRDLTFSYQIPYDASSSVEFSVGLVPRVQQMKVIAEAAKGMVLDAAQFPKATADRNPSGQRVLVTAREVQPGERAMDRVLVSLRNLPGTPMSQWIAIVLAIAMMLGGIVVAVLDRKQRLGASRRSVLNAADAERARALLAREIVSLDRARAAGEVGPKAHARIRQTLVDALARLLVVTKTEQPAR